MNSTAIEIKVVPITLCLVTRFNPSELEKKSAKDLGTSLESFTESIAQYGKCVVKQIYITKRSSNDGYFGLLASVSCQFNKKQVIDHGTHFFSISTQSRSAHVWLPAKGRQSGDVLIYTRHDMQPGEGAFFEKIRGHSDETVFGNKFGVYPFEENYAVPIEHPVLEYWFHMQVSHMMGEYDKKNSASAVQKIHTPEQRKILWEKSTETCKNTFKAATTTVEGRYLWNKAKATQILDWMREASAKAATLGDFVKYIRIIYSRTTPTQPNNAWSRASDSELTQASMLDGIAEGMHTTPSTAIHEFTFMVEVPEVKIS